MSSSFKIDYEWLSNQGDDAIEQSTLAELAINVGDLCATTVEDTFAKTVRSSARLSAFYLAEWFAANWWRLLWELKADTYSWKASHKVGNAGHGYVWPDLSFSSDWQSVFVTARHTVFQEMEPIQYLRDFQIPVSISEFQQGVENFVSGTIARLSHTQSAQSSLSMLWDVVDNERRDPDVSKHRILEACMGYNPGEAPPPLLDGLMKQADLYGASAVREMSAACKDQAMVQIDDLQEQARTNGVTVRVPKCGDIRERFRNESYDSDVPRKRATQAAQVAREVWGVGSPVPTAVFAELFGIQPATLTESWTGRRMPSFAGFRERPDSDEFDLVWNRSHRTSRRFALARLVADHIDAGHEGRLLPGTDSATSRQKFQRAFAQEFLCPFSALQDYFGGETPVDDDIDDAAAWFDVSPGMIHTLLVNKGVLDRETLPDYVPRT